MAKIILTALFFIALLTTGAQAQTLGLHIASAHLPDSGQERATIGAYVQIDNWHLGAMRNSIGRTSVIAGRVFDIGPVQILAGGITGYEYRKDGTGFGSARVKPLLLASIAGPEVMGLTPRVSVIPKAPGMRATVVHLSVEMDL